jgi:hypothetical protein
VILIIRRIRKFGFLVISGDVDIESNGRSNYEVSLLKLSVAATDAAAVAVDLKLRSGRCCSQILGVV